MKETRYKVAFISKSWWWTGKPGVLQSMGSKSQTQLSELNWRFSAQKRTRKCAKILVCSGCIYNFQHCVYFPILSHPSLSVSDGKGSTSNAGDLGMISGSGRASGEGNGNPLRQRVLSVSVKRHGERSLAVYSPWGYKESDRTEWLSLPFLYKVATL